MSQQKDIRIQSKADLQINWETNNPILLENEIGYEKDTGRLKIGDGENAWNDLSYYTNIGNGNGENSIVLNDNNNLSLGIFSVAQGSGTTAGILGYYYSNIVFGNEIQDKNGKGTGKYGPCQLILSLTQPPEVIKVPNKQEIFVGDVITVVNNSKYPNCATVKYIDGNIITVDALPFNSIQNVNDPSVDDYSFYILAKPTAGEIPLGYYAFAEGFNSKAVEQASHAEGRDTRAYGQYSHAEGRNTEANYSSHAEGYSTKASAFYCHAEGMYSEAQVEGAHAEGRENIASGWTSHAEGYKTVAKQSHAHSEGWLTTASGLASHTEGQENEASAWASHAEGRNTKANADYAHSEGNGTIASAQSAHAEGQGNQANGLYGSHAEGHSSVASGESSHAQNRATKAIGPFTHSEGMFSEAHGQAAHAEGYTTKAYGNQSHTEGRYTEANGLASHAEGTGTKANADVAHAEGAATEAKGWASHTEGNGTIASSKAQHVQGTFNIEDDANKYADIVGNGSENTKRSNAYTLDWKGNAWFAGNVQVNKQPNKNDNDLTLVTKGYVSSIEEQLNNSLKYYNDMNATPSSYRFFNFEVNDSTMTASVLSVDESWNLDLPETIVVPYEYKINNKVYTVTSLDIVLYPSRTWIFPNTLKHMTMVDCGLENINIPDGVEELGYFGSNFNLKSIIIPKSIKYIQPNALADCTEAVIYYKGNVDEWNSIKPENLTNTVYYNWNKSINQEEINNLITETVELKEYMTDSTARSKRVDNYGDAYIFPSPNELFKFGVWNEDDPYAYVRLANPNYSGKIVVPYKCNINGVEKRVGLVYSGFLSYSKVTEVIFPKDIGFEANCLNHSSLQKIPNKYINEYEIFAYTQISSVSDYNQIKYASRAFAGCQNIIDLVIPEGVKNINNAFEECNNIKTIVFPRSLNYMHETCFAGANVESIYYEGTEEEWKNKFGDNLSWYQGLENAKIYYKYTNATITLADGDEVEY